MHTLAGVFCVSSQYARVCANVSIDAARGCTCDCHICTYVIVFYVFVLFVYGGSAV